MEDSDNSLKSIKKIISSLLVSTGNGIPFNCIDDEYKNVENEYIPFRAFHCNSLKEFLEKHLGDTMYIGKVGMDIVCFPIINENIKRINNLVRKTKKTMKNRKYMPISSGKKSAFHHKPTEKYRKSYRPSYGSSSHNYYAGPHLTHFRTSNSGSVPYRGQNHEYSKEHVKSLMNLHCSSSNNNLNNQKNLQASSSNIDLRFEIMNINEGVGDISAQKNFMKGIQLTNQPYLPPPMRLSAPDDIKKTDKLFVPYSKSQAEGLASELAMNKSRVHLSMNKEMQIVKTRRPFEASEESNSNFAVNIDKSKDETSSVSFDARQIIKNKIELRQSQQKSQTLSKGLQQSIHSQQSELQPSKLTQQIHLGKDSNQQSSQSSQQSPSHKQLLITIQNLPIQMPEDDMELLLMKRKVVLSASSANQQLAATGIADAKSYRSSITSIAQPAMLTNNSCVITASYIPPVTSSFGITHAPSLVRTMSDQSGGDERCNSIFTRQTSLRGRGRACYSANIKDDKWHPLSNHMHVETKLPLKYSKEELYTIRSTCSKNCVPKKPVLHKIEMFCLSCNAAEEDAAASPSAITTPSPRVVQSLLPCELKVCDDHGTVHPNDEVFIVQITTQLECKVIVNRCKPCINSITSRMNYIYSAEDHESVGRVFKDVLYAVRHKSKWYRCLPLIDETYCEEDRITMDLIDFGSTAYVSRHDVRGLSENLKQIPASVLKIKLFFPTTRISDDIISKFRELALHRLFLCYPLSCGSFLLLDPDTSQLLNSCVVQSHINPHAK